MARPAQTARSERTREASRQAALVRFLGQGVDGTSAEQIAADAGVPLDPMRLLTHLGEVHGPESVNGMAGLMASLAVNTTYRGPEVPGTTTSAATCRCTSRSTRSPSSRHPTRCSTIRPCSRR